MATIFNSLVMLLAGATQKELARQIKYLKVENEVLRSRLPERIHVTPRERSRLLKFAGNLPAKALKQLVTIVHPDTLLRWLREERRRRNPTPIVTRGRPKTAVQIRRLILKLARENRWGYTRIMGELKKLGIQPPSPTWNTFLAEHVRDIAAIDFFVVPTATFRLLYVFFVLSHDRRRILHFNVTANPTAEWTAQQIAEAFPFETAPRLLVRDRDSIYGDAFKRRVESLDIDEVVTAARSPWQNPYAERFVGTARRECLNHFIILNERHLKRLISKFLGYYHGSRTHQGLDGDCPEHRKVEPPELGPVVSVPLVGGLHHRYTRTAA
ncbi:MAG: integrase core domain-containing protein [Pirellulales bacterium]|nr:integrase core domain-containing protein [Pirellulales bacterium]